MDPRELARHYDAISDFIRAETAPTYGLAALDRAIRFTPDRGPALDVGCGPTGRFLQRLAAAGFAPEGLDTSPRMVELARAATPDIPIHPGDIIDWPLPRRYALITAWDSTFHLPLAAQEPVLRKLCAGLLPGGVLLFTGGGGDPGEIVGEMQGRPFGYSTLGVERFVAILADCGCFCRHVEYDQWPEGHVVLIAQRR